MRTKNEEITRKRRGDINQRGRRKMNRGLAQAESDRGHDKKETI